MYYAQWRKYDTANGPGIRSTLFVSGCTHQCVGCFNSEYKSFDYGKLWTKKSEDEFLTMVSDPIVKGITLLGGEPMDQIKDDDLLRLLQRLKAEVNKNVWLYSGYTYEQILQHEKRKEMLSYCDVLVDGLFIEAQKDLKLAFKGSRNQRIVDVQASLKSGRVQLLEETGGGLV